MEYTQKIKKSNEGFNSLNGAIDIILQFQRKPRRAIVSIP